MSSRTATSSARSRQSVGRWCHDLLQVVLLLLVIFPAEMCAEQASDRLPPVSSALPVANAPDLVPAAPETTDAAQVPSIPIDPTCLAAPRAACASPYIFADALFWTVREGAADNWAQEITPNSPAGTPSGTATIVPATFAWNAGFRVGVGYQRGEDDYDTSFYFTNFTTRATSQAAGEVYSAYLANFYVSNPDGNDFGPHYQSASMRWNFGFHTLDYEVGRKYAVDRTLTLRPFVGLKAAVINQLIFSTWQNPIDTSTQTYLFTSATENLKQEFWGIGPSLGVTLTMPLYTHPRYTLKFFGTPSVRPDVRPLDVQGPISEQWPDVDDGANPDQHLDQLDTHQRRRDDGAGCDGHRMGPLFSQIHHQSPLGLRSPGLAESNAVLFVQRRPAQQPDVVARWHSRVGRQFLAQSSHDPVRSFHLRSRARSGVLSRSAQGVTPFADVLAWHASEQTSSIWSSVVAIDPLNGQTTFAPADVRFNWNAGMRIGIAHVPQEQGWDVKLYWTYFRTSQNVSVAPGSGLVLPEFFSGFVSGDSSAFTAAALTWSLVFNTVDLEAGHEISVGEFLHLRPTMGLKIASINQSIHSLWANPATSASATENVTNNFLGVGPSFGIGGRWDVPKFPTVSLIGSFSGALMYGLWNVDDAFQNNNPLTVANQYTAFNTSMRDSALGTVMLRYFFGLQWTHQGAEVTFMRIWATNCNGGQTSSD